MLALSNNLVIEREITDSFSIAYFNNREYEQLMSHRLAYHRILLIRSGSGGLQIDDHVFEVASSLLFLIAKGQLLQFNEGATFTGYELSFGDCFWEKTPSSANNCKAVLFNNAAANQVIPLFKKDYAALAAVFKPLADEFKKEAYSNKLDAMAAYLKIIMIKIANVNNSLSTGFDGHENQLYSHFLELVSQQYKTNREVAEYARQLGISARKLADLSKRCGAIGAKELINGQLLAEAKRALQFTSDPIKEIAFELNFATPEQFSHFFKKNAKIAPNDYRALFLSIGT